MKLAKLTMSVAVLSLGLFMTPSMAAQDPAPKAPRAERPTISGTFVSTASGKLVMSTSDGKEHTHAFAKDVKYTIDGKAAALDAFKKGMHISLTTDAGGNVTAMSGQVVKPATATAPAVKITAPAVKTTAPAAKAPAPAAKATPPAVQPATPAPSAAPAKNAGK